MYFDVSGTLAYRYYTYNTSYATHPGADVYDWTPDTRVTSREGYTFDGWYTAESGETKIFNSDGTLVKSVQGYSDSEGRWIKYDANVTLYAHWTADGLATSEQSEPTAQEQSESAASEQSEPTAQGQSEPAINGQMMSADEQQSSLMAQAQSNQIDGQQSNSLPATSANAIAMPEQSSTSIAETQNNSEAEELPEVAQVAGKNYTSLEEAISASTNGGTIKLLDNVKASTELVIEENKNIVINLNGKSITSTSANTITNKGMLTITGAGTIRNEQKDGVVIENLRKSNHRKSNNNNYTKWSKMH